MNSKLKIIIGLIIYLIMPVLMAYTVAKLFVNYEGTKLFIIFISLIVLEILAVIIKIIKYKNDKKTNKK